MGPPLYDSPEQHLDAVLRWVEQVTRSKYLAGQDEHGGRLWEKPVLGDLLAEHIDKGVYLCTLTEKLTAIAEECRRIRNELAALDTHDPAPATVHEAVRRLSKLVTALEEL